MGFYKRLFCSSFNSPVLTGAPASQQRGHCKVPALFWWQTWVQGMAQLELGSPPTTPGWGRGDRLQGPADLSNWAPGPAIAGKSQYSAGQEKTTNTCGKDGPAGRGSSFLGFQGQREAFGYDQDYSPLAGQARLCLVLAGLLQRGQAALRRDSAQLRCPLTPGGSQGAGTQLHPGSSLLKNLEENGAAVNTLHQCRCNIPRSQLLLLQHQARWTKAGVACGFCAAGTNDRLEKAYGPFSRDPATCSLRVQSVDLLLLSWGKTERIGRGPASKVLATLPFSSKSSLFPPHSCPNLEHAKSLSSCPTAEHGLSQEGKIVCTGGNREAGTGNSTADDRSGEGGAASSRRETQAMQLSTALPSPSRSAP